VLLVDTDRYANYEHFENILLDATADPPFGGSNNATITITSHSSGEEVQDTEATLEGYITSGDTLVNELLVWNTWQPLDSMVKTIVSEAGDFSVPVQLEPGENNFVLLTRGLSFSFVYRGGGLMVDIPNNPQSGFVLIHDDEPLPGHLRFDVEIEAIDQLISSNKIGWPYIPKLVIHNTLKDSFVDIYANNDGDLDKEPFAVGEDLTKYDAEGKAASGKLRFTVSRVDPGEYWIQARGSTYTWGDPRVRTTKITVAGIVSGTYSMQNGIPNIDHMWIGVRYDTATGDIEVIDESIVY
jgi:PKD repeat protein